MLTAPPQIALSEFHARRQRLFAALPMGATAVIAAAEIQHRNADTEYTFRQDSDFWYLTGFNEPGAVAFLHKKLDGTTAFIVFVASQDEAQAVWTGPVLGPQGACDLGADQAYDLSELSRRAGRLCAEQRYLYWLLGSQDRLMPQILTWLQERPRKRQADFGLMDLKPLLHAQRQLKSPAEIEIMRYVAHLSAASHRALLGQPYQYEYEIAAAFQAYVQRYNCHLAYPTIVGGGERACILHYTQNTHRLSPHMSVLVDAGAEWAFYAADITRTWPQKGAGFTTAQRSIYQVVLSAQKAVIAAIKPGLAWEALQEIAVDKILAGLLELQILQGDLAELKATKAYLPFYMHGIGHWLGLDVHDVGPYVEGENALLLKPGMVFTVEPGLYLRAGHVSSEWEGIGVRIEDNILVTEQGCEVLTSGAPKELSEIEYASS